jgi:hypothetical protein
VAKKRKRKRRPAAPRQPAQEAAPAESSAPRAARGAGPGPPSPPWGSFPLSELVVLLAVVLLIAGFFIGPPQGPVMLGAGLVLGSLAGLELAVREHFSGFRSHTLLLAAAAGVAVVLAAVLVFDLSPLLGLIAGAAVFGALTWPLANVFRSRSGGALFKVWR